MIIRSKDRPLCIPRDILVRRDLAPATKLLYAYFYDQDQRQTDSYTQAYKEHAERLGLSERQVRLALRQLERADLLVLGEEAIGAHLTKDVVVGRIGGATK